MSKDYPAVQITTDAAKFAKSRFGQHKLAGLLKQRDFYVEHACRMDLSDNYRAHLMTRVAVYDEVIGYFKTAEAIQSDPKLMKRLHDKAKGRSEGQTDV